MTIVCLLSFKRIPGSKPFIGIFDTLFKLNFIFVFYCSRVWVPDPPEFLDKFLFGLFIRKLFIYLYLIICHDEPYLFKKSPIKWS